MDAEAHSLQQHAELHRATAPSASTRTAVDLTLCCPQLRFALPRSLCMQSDTAPPPPSAPVSRVSVPGRLDRCLSPAQRLPAACQGGPEHLADLQVLGTRHCGELPALRSAICPTTLVLWGA